MQNLLIALTLLFSSAIMAQTQENKKRSNNQTIEVLVVNVLNDKGTVEFAFYNEEGFMQKPLFTKSATVKDGVSTVTFENIEAGEYAVICFHDKNSNHRMDFHENGMPKEDFGTSNNVMEFGPPQFDTSKFEVKNESITLEIKF